MPFGFPFISGLNARASYKKGNSRLFFPKNNDYNIDVLVSHIVIEVFPPMETAAIEITHGFRFLIKTQFRKI